MLNQNSIEAALCKYSVTLHYILLDGIVFFDRLMLGNYFGLCAPGRFQSLCQWDLDVPMAMMMKPFLPVGASRSPQTDGYSSLTTIQESLRGSATVEDRLRSMSDNLWNFVCH